MVQLSLRQDPPWMQSQLPEGTKSTCIVASSVLRRGQPDSRESCIVLQSGLTRSLVANFSQQYANFVLQGKNAVNEATVRCVQTFDV